MAEEQTQPQFISWAKEAGVFRPAELKMPENYAGCDLERNIELGEREISPRSLNLVSSVYLGAVNILEEAMGNHMGMDEFELLRLRRHGAVCQIVGLAEDLAQNQGIPYFSVNIVKTPKDRTWEIKRTRTKGLYDEIPYKEKHSFVDKLDRSREPTEFVLHPTAQLYVPRE